MAQAKGKSVSQTTNKEQKKDTPITETAPAKSKVKPTITDQSVIYVKSNRFGRLIFVDKRSGEKVVWTCAGEIHPLPMSTLRSMKASAARFFSDNMIIVTGAEDENICPSDVYNALFVSQYYKDIIDPDNFGKVCNWSINEIEEKVPMLTVSAKENLLVALNEFVANGQLDSLRKIKAFEKALGRTLKKPE